MLADAFFYPLVRKQLILFRCSNIEKSQDLFQYGLLDYIWVKCGVAADDAGMGIEKDKAWDIESTSLKLDGDFMGDHTAKRIANKIVGTARIKLLESVGIIPRHIAN
ncbi:hypothetical protein A5781_14885 [Mycobacterium sp. 852002-30065_SCH5024008]|nr:hypothetical protein A5781_14885 [Mycobacterium sp. 852002-30065_SCH5024008]